MAAPATFFSLCLDARYSVRRSSEAIAGPSMTETAGPTWGTVVQFTVKFCLCRNAVQQCNATVRRSSEAIAGPSMTETAGPT